MTDSPNDQDDTSQLPLQEWVDDVADQFEAAWDPCASPAAIAETLGDATGERRRLLLHELVKIDLECRWQAGQQRHLDDYLSELPELLGPDSTLPDELVLAARSIAQRHGGDVSLAGDFGDYELLEEIARGGMGVVYKARQVSLDRIVALKMILAGQLASETDLRRFHTEAAAAAALDHPGIVPIFEVGQHEGQHFFSMGFVEGQSLAAIVARGPLEPHQAAEIVKAVAEAAQYAHEKGLIHRDLKPANILMDRAGNPRVTDFGLAKQVTGDRGLTVSGQILGTPSYMPPEQAAGKLQEIGPASDVYALGGVLYTLLTGRLPFQTANPLDTLRYVVEREPIAPRRLKAHIPRDLETICLRAMQKKPEKRYQTAADLAADLERYLNGYAIVARRVGPVGRMIRWAKRSRAVATSLLLVAILGLVAAFLAYQSHQANERLLQHAFNEAVLEMWSGNLDKADEAIEEAERLGAATGFVLMLRGQLALHRNETEDAAKHLERAVQLLPDSPAAQAMLAVAYWQDGKWEKCEKTLEHLDLLPPVTPEDYLFKGYAQATIDPSRGLENIDKAIRLRPNWTIAHALGAEVRSWVAQDQMDPSLIEQASDDARIVKKMLPDKSLGPQVSLYANLVAATIYAGQPQNQEEALDRAKQDFQKLGALPASGWSVLLRYRYLEYRGNGDEAFQEMKLARRNVKSSWPPTFYALGLYRRGDFRGALNVLDGLDKNDLGAFQETMRMFILAELPGGHEKAMAVYRKATGRHQGTTPIFQNALLYLLGRREDAVAAYCEFQLPKALAKVRDGSCRELLDYNRGRTTPDELLSAVEDSTYHECNAHFFIAMSLLAEGDRAGAREHFGKCISTGCFDFDASDWSRSFLARMDQDPNWPRWIVPKAEATLQPP